MRALIALGTVLLLAVGCGSIREVEYAFGGVPFSVLLPSLPDSTVTFYAGDGGARSMVFQGRQESAASLWIECYPLGHDVTDVIELWSAEDGRWVVAEDGRSTVYHRSYENGHLFVYAFAEDNTDLSENVLFRRVAEQLATSQDAAMDGHGATGPQP